MGFKLGSETGNHAVNGEIRKKLRFNKQSGESICAWNTSY